MSNQAHQRVEPTHAVEYTVKITVTVAGSAGSSTVRRRAATIAQRLADTATRSRHVLDVTAVAGPSIDGDVLEIWPVHFPLANRGTQTDGLRDRWTHPQHVGAIPTRATPDDQHRHRDSGGRRTGIPGSLRQPRARR